MTEPPSPVRMLLSRHTSRREFITLLGSAAASAIWPRVARAQPAKVPTIGFLGAATLSSTSKSVTAFVQRLRELGWIEGRTVAIEYRWGEGRNERFAEIAAEFVRLKVDVIVTSAVAALVVKAGDIGDPGLCSQCGGPAWYRPGRELGATGQQRHRPVDPICRYWQQEARNFARGYPGPPQVGDHRQCWLPCL